MNRFLIFDNPYGNCKGDTANFLAGGAAHEIDAVREMCMRAGRFPVRLDRLEDADPAPRGFAHAYVVFSVPHDSTIDSEDLNFYENEDYIKMRGGELTAIVFTFDSLPED